MNSPLFLFLGDLGGGEIMLIMVVILIFFGANKIPELARGLGKGIREFKDASSEIRNEIEGSGQPRQSHQQSYQQPQQYATQAPVTEVPTPVVPVQAPASTVAPPMDGGTTPPTPTQHHEPVSNRLDQTS